MSDWASRTNEKLGRVANGKTVERVYMDDESPDDNSVVLSFADGSELRIHYDWIYGWQMKDKNGELLDQDEIDG